MDFPTLAAKRRSAFECMAVELSRGYGGTTLKDELVQAGLVGLWQATQRYDDQVENTFWSFAYPRVRGAMLDELRSLSHRSRTAHDAVKDETWLSRSPWALVFAAPLDDARDQEDDSPHPATSLEARETGILLRRLLHRLPRDLAYVLRRHYFEEATLKQLGAELGVTESRACQMEKLGVKRLRELVTPSERAELVSEKRSPTEKPRRSQRMALYNHGGKSLTLTEWADELKIPVTTLSNRLRLGWPTSRVLGEPVRFKRREKDHVSRL